MSYKNSKDENDNKKSVTELKADYDKACDLVRSKKVSFEKKAIPQSDEKSELGKTYLAAADIAKQLSKKCVDSEDRKTYEQHYDKLVKMARSFGSTVKTDIPKTKLDDVKGLEEVKKLVKNFIFIAEHGELITKYKLTGGLGALMYGPPGTGKTMIAEAIANEMNVPFFMITPADIFKPYVGESEQSVRQIFDEVDSCAEGAVLFVDECESIFTKRSGDTKDYKSAVTTELLQRINGFGINGNKRVLIAATNRPDMIDPAYLRFKRFSNLIFVDLPDRTAKEAIIKGKLPTEVPLLDITVDQIVNMACDSDKLYSAADICGIIESACMSAIYSIQDEHNKNPKGVVSIKPLTYEMFQNAFANCVVKLDQETYDSYKNFKIEE